MTLSKMPVARVPDTKLPMEKLYNINRKRPKGTKKENKIKKNLDVLDH